MEFTDTQLKYFRDRYAHEGESTPIDMWKRLSRWLASKEINYDYWYNRFLNSLWNFKLVLGGRVNFAGGHKAPQVTAHNCFVGPMPDDSREGILHSLFEEVETMAAGGGFGINFSSLRGRGALTKGNSGMSSGAVNWMQLFTTASKDIVQQGGTRRGALMLILNDDHPDLGEFINAKRTPGRLEGANLSVGVQRNPNELANWGDIIQAAWASGEPGVVFLDKCNAENNLYYLPEMRIEATNPCSEIPLPAYGCCLLGTVNLDRYVWNGMIQWNEMGKDIHTMVRMLDNVIDLSYYPLKEYYEHQQKVRQMGCGFTGIADGLIKLGVRYGSEEAIRLVSKLYQFLAEESYRASIELAKERGSFPVLDRESFVEGEFVKRLPNDIRTDILQSGIRNAYLVGQQPSGTGSLIAAVNSGIEPYFDFDLERLDRTGISAIDTEATRAWVSAGKPNGSSIFATAHDLTPIEHVDMQAAAQYWSDQAISKTVNAPEHITVEEVDRLYRYAYEKGLKSIAFYRDNSRHTQVLYTKGQISEGMGDLTLREVEEINMANCRTGSCDV